MPLPQILTLPSVSRITSPTCPACQRYALLSGQCVCWPCVIRAHSRCPHPAGSEERIRTLCARAQLGLDLFRDDDNRALAKVASAYTSVPVEERNIVRAKRRWVARVGGGSSRNQVVLGRFPTREEAVAARRKWLEGRRAAG